ncbi:MAG: thermonuclease family protein [Rickettsiales bacterium]|nr:thermonuclease family protein [Rickettsiales bacterium]
MKYLYAIFLLTFILLPFESHAIKVVDGDTLKIDDVVVRLHGIDAPEPHQQCKRYGRPYPCGKEAEAKLRELVTEKTSCIIKGVDPRDNILSVCRDGDVDINAEMVKNGYALAARNHYKKEENDARKHHRGIWKGSFDHPQFYITR